MSTLLTLIFTPVCFFIGLCIVLWLIVHMIRAAWRALLNKLCQMLGTAPPTP